MFYYTSTHGFRFDFSRVKVTRALAAEISHTPCCSAYNQGPLEGILMRRLYAIH